MTCCFHEAYSIISITIHFRTNWEMHIKFAMIAILNSNEAHLIDVQNTQVLPKFKLFKKFKEREAIEQFCKVNI